MNELPDLADFRSSAARALILQDLAQSEMIVAERSDRWTEQDQRELMTFSLQYAAEMYPEDEALV